MSEDMKPIVKKIDNAASPLLDKLKKSAQPLLAAFAKMLIKSTETESEDKSTEAKATVHVAVDKADTESEVKAAADDS